MKMSKNLFLITMHHIGLISGIMYYGFNIWIAIAIFFISMMYAKFSGSDIMHFYFAHGKYKDGWKGYLYTIPTLFSGLGSPISFSASHRQHHKYVDTDKDPHSPHIIGWRRVYFLDWAPQNINPRLIADFARSKFQKNIHRYYFKIHIVLVILFALIDPRIVCFLLSPFVLYSFHNSSCVNVFAHLDGESKNVPWIKIINWWGWDHGDHHDYKPSK